MQKTMEFTQDWFSGHIPNWSRLLTEFRDKPGIRALEIGVFEGRSTCWLLENILTGKDATVHCVDTFGGSREHADVDMDMDLVKARFEANTAQWRERIQLHVGPSLDILPTLSGPFDIVYIDGSHTACDVLMDTLLSWRLASDNAVIIFDDYRWQHFPGQPWFQPQMAIDAFLNCYVGWYQILHAGYQIAIRKLPSFQPPEQKKSEFDRKSPRQDPASQHFLYGLPPSNRFY